MSQSYVKKVGNQFFVRYANSTAWVFIPGATTLTECQACCPNTALTLWESPNVACNDVRVTHPIDLLSPYFHIHQPIKSYLEAAKANNRTAIGAYSALCGSPPQANLSSIITIQIPYDPIFAGTYTFSYTPSTTGTTGWRLIESNGRTSTSLPAYSSSNVSRQGPFQNQKLITLEQTSTEPTYKGYVEVARYGNSTSNISGVFAFPAHFVFSAISPPTDIDTVPFPTTSGHRAVLGFTVPIRWRKEYSDWIVVDQVGHKVSGSKYSNPVTPDYWMPSTNLSISGYATSRSGSGVIGLSGITNNPATYNLYDISTAITGSCSMSFMAADTEWSEGPVPYSGLAHMGFCYRTSASGLPYHEDNVMDLNDFMGIRQVFNNHTINTTRLLDNKQDMEAWITFPNSCRTSGTTCSDSFYGILGGVPGALPVSTGSTMISGTCIGSYINADFSCRDAITRPDATYFSTEGITGIKPLYLGTSDNVYPFVKVNANSGNVYMAGSGQNIFIDYNGPHTLDDFRKWVNTEFSFVEISGNNNIIIDQWPGVDLYWQVVGPSGMNTASNTYPDIMFARLIPCDSAANEGSSKGLYVLKINDINVWEAAGQPTAEFLGQYAHDSNNNRYILIGNDNIQIRFIVDRWSLGKLVGDTFVEYYTLSNTTGGDPTLGDPDYYTHFNDYSDPGSYVNGNWYPIGNYCPCANYQPQNSSNISESDCEDDCNECTENYVGGNYQNGYIRYYQCSQYNGINAPTSTWNTVQIPVDCLSLPIGQWSNVVGVGTGVAITVVDPIPASYNGNNPC